MKDYKVLDRLGEGAHGIVMKAQEISTGQIVALKKICIKPSQILPVNVFREIKVLQHLDHPNVWISSYFIGNTILFMGEVHREIKKLAS
jgi:cell cycle related kinase